MAIKENITKRTGEIKVKVGKPIPVLN